MPNPTSLPQRITPDFVARNRDGLIALAKTQKPLRLDASNLQVLDGLGLAFLAGLERECQSAGNEIVLLSLAEPLQKRLRQSPVPVDTPETPRTEKLPEKVGEAGYAFLDELKDLLLLSSEALYWSTWGLFRRKTILPGDFVKQMIRLGSSALPIVLLLSLLIGFTLAVQSGNQLQQYGASIFLADGLGIGMVTEIGPVLTAVIVAGRSGSAVTAEIATMNVQEEIAALRTMAVNPFQYIMLPRFWSLSICLPLLTALAAAAGVFSGMLVGYFVFHLSMRSFLSELGQAVLVEYVFQMIVKSLTFGWIIALVAVNKGMRVSGGADAVGRATTECVVTCIFSIIVADAIFSFLFYF